MVVPLQPILIEDQSDENKRDHLLAFRDFCLDLSAYAEDHGLCPWMNADSVTKSFLCPQVNATADSATGGYPAEALALAQKCFSANGRRRVCHGGTTGFARGAPFEEEFGRIPPEEEIDPRFVKGLPIRT